MTMIVKRERTKVVCRLELLDAAARRRRRRRRCRLRSQPATNPIFRYHALRISAIGSTADFVHCIETPAVGLLPEQEEMAEMGAATSSIDHCVAANTCCGGKTPADIRLGLCSSKPSRYVYQGWHKLPDLCGAQCTAFRVVTSIATTVGSSSTRHVNAAGRSSAV